MCVGVGVGGWVCVRVGATGLSLSVSSTTPDVPHRFVHARTRVRMCAHALANARACGCVRWCQWSLSRTASRTTTDVPDRHKENDEVEQREKDPNERCPRPLIKVHPAARRIGRRRRFAAEQVFAGVRGGVGAKRMVGHIGQGRGNGAVASGENPL